MTSSVQVIEDHYMRYFGEPTHLHLIKLDIKPATVLRLQEYGNVPSQGAKALLTLGLSSADTHAFREELLFLCYAQFISEELYSLLASVAKKVATSQHPLYKGEVLMLEKPLPSTPVEALYVYAPVYLPKGFEPIMTDDEGPTHVAWLVPIRSSEANWIENQDAGAFEDLLQDADPDLMDLCRHALI